MKSPFPTVSVIIPTHNRSSAVRTLLSCLENQTYPAGFMEVVVVTGSSQDTSVEMLENYRAPFTLRLFHKSGPGPAEKRNEGTARASGKILIFLDDDMEPQPQFVAEHVTAHLLMQSPCVIIGYSPPVGQGKTGYLEMALRDWWEDIFHQMRHPGHRFTFRDMLSGNFSINASLFAQLNGFAIHYHCREDYEFGFRLLKAGVRLAHAPQAVAYHRDSTSVERLLARKYQEGKFDVLMGRQHPDVRSTLPMKDLLKHSLPPSSILCTLAFQWPAAGNVIVKMIRLILDVAEFLQMRRVWRTLLLALQFYFYCRGIASELQTMSEVRCFLDKDTTGTTVTTPEITIDLELGLTRAEQLLDERRPHSVSIQHNGYLVRQISPQPGAEPLRGVHLRPLLTGCQTLPVLKSVALVGDAIVRTSANGLKGRPF